MSRHIWLVAGTTEGRHLAESLAGDARVQVYATVATDYGASLLPSADNIHVFQARLTGEQMQQFMGEHQIDLVLDATHPYAQMVTEAVQKACRRAQVKYWRLLRPADDCSGCITVPNFEEAVELLSHTEGGIFLTTGSKNLSDFQHLPDYQQRVTLRILPLPASLQKAMDCGYERSHIICMQGPFAEDLNQAMFRTYQTKYVVSKDSGAAGGFPEKLAAAQAVGAKMIVIARKQETGSSYAKTAAQLQRYLEGETDVKG